MRRIHGWTSLAAVAALALGGAAAVPAAAQTGGGVAVGETQDGAARLRLASRTLTISLARATAPRVRRIDVAVTCGDAVDTWDPPISWGVSAGATARVSGRARRIELRLSRGVAAQANHCHTTFSRGGRLVSEFDAELRHETGLGACRRGTADRVVARGEETIVVATPRKGWNTDDSPGDVLRACPRATGRFVTIGDTGSYAEGRAGSRRLAHLAVAGQRIAWAVSETAGMSGSPGPFSSGSQLVVLTADLAVPDLARTRTVALDGAGRIPYLEPRAFGELVLSPSGVVAWVARLVPDQLQVRALDGTVRTLDTGAIAGLAVSPDGATLSWREAGVERSAPLA